MGTDHETNTDRSYTPIFEPVVNPALDQALVLEVCGNNQFCVFDFQTTGSQGFAQASVESFIQYEIAVQNTEIGSYKISGSLSNQGGGIPWSNQAYSCDDISKLNFSTLLV